MNSVHAQPLLCGSASNAYSRSLVFFFWEPDSVLKLDSSNFESAWEKSPLGLQIYIVPKAPLTR